MVVGLKGRGVHLTYRDLSRFVRKRVAREDRRVYTLDHWYICIYI